MFENKKKFLSSMVCSLTLIISFPMAVFAQSSSDNYQIEEYYFGTGGEVDASSDNYRARQSTGSLGVGTSTSDNFDLEAGSTTTSDPFLEMAVSGATVNFGLLDYTSTSSGAAQAGDCNCSFHVKSYLTSGYIVTTISQPPTSENGDEIDGMTFGSPSTDNSVEQFGMNLKANTIYGGFGAERVNQPDDSFADGKAAPGYDTADNFKYAPGDTIAFSQETSGEPAIGLTEYTISYILKPGINTPAGNYQMNQHLVVVATF
jgi:hypothetical protein